MYNPNDDQVALHNNSNPPPPLPVALQAVPVESWSRQHDKIFETALLMYPEESLYRWEKISTLFPGRTPDEMRVRYDVLVNDVSQIEAGRFELPRYDDDDDNVVVATRGKAWTEEEHRRFVAGLEKYGKGDWRSISRKFVLTRSSTQVASHAQKYFQRQTAPTKVRKRSSIHDITSAAASPDDQAMFRCAAAAPDDQAMFRF